MSSGFVEETCHSFLGFSKGKQAVSWDDKIFGEGQVACGSELVGGFCLG